MYFLHLIKILFIFNKTTFYIFKNHFFVIFNWRNCDSVTFIKKCIKVIKCTNKALQTSPYKLIHNIIRAWILVSFSFVVWWWQTAVGWRKECTDLIYWHSVTFQPVYVHLRNNWLCLVRLPFYQFFFDNLLDRFTQRFIWECRCYQVNSLLIQWFIQSHWIGLVWLKLRNRTIWLMELKVSY